MKEYLVPLNGEVEIEEIPIKGSHCLFKYFPGRSPYGVKTHGYSYSTTGHRGRGNLILKDGKIMRKDLTLTIKDDNEKTHEIEIVGIKTEGMLLRYFEIEE